MSSLGHGIGRGGRGRRSCCALAAAVGCTGSVVGRLGITSTVPPTVPAERVAVLRTAWEAMLKDPVFQADVKKRKAAIDARTAAQVEAAIKRTLATPDNIVRKIVAASKE